MSEKLKQDHELVIVAQEKQDLFTSYAAYKSMHNRILEEKTTALNLFKQEYRVSEEDLLKKGHQLESASAQVDKLETENGELRGELEKLRQRFNLLKQNRSWALGRNLKSMYCKNCKLEYSESENFNWSCIFHRGEWGGDIWWCCGKTHKNSRGCKYQKHYSKEEADESEEMKKLDVFFKKVVCTVSHQALTTVLVL